MSEAEPDFDQLARELEKALTANEPRRPPPIPCPHCGANLEEQALGRDVIELLRAEYDVTAHCDACDKAITIKGDVDVRVEAREDDETP